MIEWDKYVYHWSRDKDPIELVGGHEENISKSQLKFLQGMGLKPEHTLLDFGCGCLRGSYLTHQYLNQGNFYGLDCSPKLLGVAMKRQQVPCNLKLNSDFNIKSYFDMKFDYITAWSVLTHLLLEDVQPFFTGLSEVMTPETKCFVTCFLKDEYTGGIGQVWYPLAILQENSPLELINLGKVDGQDMLQCNLK